MKLATRVIAMQLGEIVQDGKPENVMPQLVARSGTNNTVSSRRSLGGALDVI
jgi:ABC-type cobalamin/Fe3+-siderophores transport system ATPase subunit